MKLDKPITIHPNKTRDNDGKIVTPDPITLSSLSVVYVDNPDSRAYYLNVQHIPSPIFLWKEKDYDDAGDITKAMARERLYELSNLEYGVGNQEAFFQSFFPRTLEDDPYGPGTILHSMFSMLGIKAGPQCSCKRHAIEMNTKGIEWCENNREIILGWLEKESKNRRIPWVETLGNMVLTRAINKARKYREQQKDG